MTPSKAFEATDNFDALRFLFAACVAVFHFVVLVGAPSLLGVATPLSVGADLSVSGFFVLSGYLVLGSLERSKSLASYFEKRVRRLYPAYAVVILLCALGALISSAEARSDLAGVARYVIANLSFLNFLEPTLPGLFEDNPYTAVNGALWTLKLEVAFYCLLPIIAFAAAKLKNWQWLLFAGLYLGAEIWRTAFRDAPGGLSVLAHQLPGQMSYFITGMALWKARDVFTPRLLAAILGLAALVASYLVPALEWSRAAGLGLLVIAIAKAPFGAPSPIQLGDISYGLYIVHFPIIQAVKAGAGQAPVWAQAVLCAALIVFAAALLWRFVERPLLHAGSHYRTRGAAPLATSALN